MANKPRQLTNLSLDQFLQPVFAAYARSGIVMSLHSVDNNIVRINVDKRQCGG